MVAFIQPNHILLKRQQKHFKREIFTLAHELGHYLLNEEELDHINFDQPKKKIENWCNEFAFYFLIEDQKETLHRIQNIQYENDTIKKISQEKHINRLALFTHLATKEKMTWERYFSIKSEIEKEYKEIFIENFIKNEKEKKRKKELGIKQTGGSPKPILSKLEMQIYENAYFERVIDRYEIESNFKNNLSYFKDIL